MHIFLSFISEIVAIFLSMAPYLLLGLSIAGVLHVIFRRELIARHLGKGDFLSIIKAALLGVPLPLCSCGVIPTALSLRKNNASEGATVAFLISTPQTGVDSIIATYGMLGGLFAVFTPVAALITGVVGGVAVTILKRNSQKEGQIVSQTDCNLCPDTAPHIHSFMDKLKGMYNYAYKEFLDDISLHLMIGILISAVIGFIVPDDFFSRYINNNFISMILMVAAGVPLYICATASIPIALVLMLKGLSPGAAFVFLTVGPATNAATITMIAHAMGKKVVSIYLSVIIVMSFLAGSVLNYLYTIPGIKAGFKPVDLISETPGTLSIIFSLMFAGFLLGSIIRKVRNYLNKGSSQNCQSGCCKGG